MEGEVFQQTLHHVSGQWSTKFSLLKGSSENLTVDAIAGFYAEQEAHVHAFTLLARVLSTSNVVDPPSRNDISLLFFKQATDVSEDAANIMRALVTRLDENGEKGCVTSRSGKSRSNADVTATLM